MSAAVVVDDTTYFSWITETSRLEKQFEEIKKQRKEATTATDQTSNPDGSQKEPCNDR